jgi:hypothetical protein
MFGWQLKQVVHQPECGRSEAGCHAASGPAHRGQPTHPHRRQVQGRGASVCRHQAHGVAAAGSSNGSPRVDEQLDGATLHRHKLVGVNVLSPS